MIASCFKGSVNATKRCPLHTSTIKLPRFEAFTILSVPSLKMNVLARCKTVSNYVQEKVLGDYKKLLAYQVHP